MKTNFLIALILIASSFKITAQITISGVVRDSLNNPVPFAQVYFSKSTIGTAANDSGVYKLNIPQSGIYELVVSSIGFKTFSKNIHAEDKNLVENIRLSSKSKVLDEVTITAKDKKRKKNYAAFIGVFLGATSNAAYCRIMNPEDIRLHMDNDKKVLEGYSVNPILIENRALGYIITYDLKDFKYYTNSGLFSFAGNSYFLPLPGSHEEEYNWRKQRLLTYYGSQLHFLRSLYAENLTGEKFVLQEYNQGIMNENIVSNRSISQEQIILARHNDCVEVYFPRKVSISYEGGSPAYLGSGNLPVESKIRFSRPVKVYPNGYFEDGYSVVWEGRMANDRVASMLPHDYQPKLY